MITHIDLKHFSYCSTSSRPKTKLLCNWPSFPPTWREIQSGPTNIYIYIYIYIYIQYCSDNKIEKNEMGWACSAYGEKRAYTGFSWGKPEGKRPLGRPRLRWEDIKMDLQEVGRGEMNWIFWLSIGTGGGLL
jgi:hypothetical protein